MMANVFARRFVAGKVRLTYCCTSDTAYSCSVFVFTIVSYCVRICLDFQVGLGFCLLPALQMANHGFSAVKEGCGNMACYISASSDEGTLDSEQHLVSQTHKIMHVLNFLFFHFLSDRRACFPVSEGFRCPCLCKYLCLLQLLVQESRAATGCVVLSEQFFLLGCWCRSCSMCQWCGYHCPLRKESGGSHDCLRPECC